MKKIVLIFGITKWRHKLYDELIYCPPEGFTYEIVGLDQESFVVKNFRKVYNILKVFSGGLISNFGRDLLAKYFIYTRKSQKSLFHFCNFIPISDKPFVADLEGLYSFLSPKDFTTFIQDTSVIYNNVDKILYLISQESCKFLLPWSNAAKNDIIELLGPAKASRNLLEKIQPIHLAIRIKPQIIKKKHEGFNVLFPGTSNFKGEENFFWRGGLKALRVFNLFAKDKNDVKLHVTGEIPIRYQHSLDHNKIIYHGLLNGETYENLLHEIDVLLFPSYTTPGLTFLEMMMQGIPIITTNAYANHEYVGDAGIICDSKFFTNLRIKGTLSVSEICKIEQSIIDEELENKLLEGLNFLYSNRDEMIQLGMNGRKRVTEGPLSINARNEKLKNIYEIAWSYL